MGCLKNSSDMGIRVFFAGKVELAMMGCSLADLSGLAVRQLYAAPLAPRIKASPRHPQPTTPPRPIAPQRNHERKTVGQADVAAVTTVSAVSFVKDVFYQQ